MGIVRYALGGLVLVSAVAIIGGYVVLRNGLAADRAPSRVEAAVARRLVVLSIPASTRALSNPRSTDQHAWREGAEHFADHCAVCHGTDGRGRSAFGGTMYPPVPDLASLEVQGLSDGALFGIIQNGVRWTGMPAFRAEHSADETWNLVSFIRRVPSLAPQDIKRSEHEHDADHQEAHVVTMDGTGFTPKELTVGAGDTVTWINKDPFPHNVASTAAGFASGDVEPDSKWQWRASRAGRFRYVCTLHPGMTGTLIVEPARKGE